eukprot:CAMPEP_0179078012 /NCGR_PEP_ID=MMETSP0796-20121207/34906_1 /TAXON_ID=73915 /ORGANISM="Pyrodinium bahamense, Strain pbaha01" /LENGTH=139 /DNA_ID=CAMNT_0020775301 /DNA_START=44 /DNA_END=464 /DNA_ORIENTATION=+
MAPACALPAAATAASARLMEPQGWGPPALAQHAWVAAPDSSTGCLGPALTHLHGTSALGHRGSVGSDERSVASWRCLPGSSAPDAAPGLEAERHHRCQPPPAPVLSAMADPGPVPPLDLPDSAQPRATEVECLGSLACF